MRIYEASSRQFSDDVALNRITERLSSRFRDHYGRKPGAAESQSWNNSLQFVRNLIEYNSLWDNYIILEYELPYSSCRLDCIFFGKGGDARANVVVMELKQWSSAQDCGLDDNVRARTGGADRIVAHPSHQVRAYRIYLEDFVELFSEVDAPDLHACAYCHNYARTEKNDILYDLRFRAATDECPLFGRDDIQRLSEYLTQRLQQGEGLELFNRFVKSPIRPSKKLLDYTSRIIQGETAFHLIDDQLAAFNAIMAQARRCTARKTKSVILVRGGPGTGKSVIALNLMASLGKEGFTCLHATGSKTFTSILRKIVGPRARNQFRYFNNFLPSTCEQDGMDVLLCDEAHRLRSSSNSRFTKQVSRSSLSQIEELLRAARVAVFFIDDFQVVRAGEIGSSELIHEATKRQGSDIHEFELTTQFRCNGSDGYLSWINNTIEVGPTGLKMLTPEVGFEFRIFDDPKELYDAICKHHRMKQNSARLVAGFCWPWSNPNPDGTLVTDVVIGDFKIPWEGRDPQETRIKLAPSVPPWFLWGHDPNGINQAGCIYTIQGLEFEYVGVIFGNDLVYREKLGAWVPQIENSRDGQLKRQGGDHLQYLKNIYRVLLTRGMKGCYVYFVDKETEKHFRSRIGSASAEMNLVPFENALPLLKMRAAADSAYERVEGLFADESNYDWHYVAGGPFAQDRFLVVAEGDSMEPKIPNQAFCLFRKDQGGSRNGKVVLCRVPGRGGSAPMAVIKQYYSKRAVDENSEGEASEIILRSFNQKHSDIVLAENEELEVIGIFEKVLA